MDDIVQNPNQQSTGVSPVVPSSPQSVPSASSQPLHTTPPQPAAQGPIGQPVPDDTSTTTIIPSYVPGKPGVQGGILLETPPPAINIEVSKPTGPIKIERPPDLEKKPAIEILTTPTPIVETIKEEEGPLIKPMPAQPTPVKGAVDKTKDITRLHHLTPPDKLTSIADEEEEEFIKDVEAAHGHN